MISYEGIDEAELIHGLYHGQSTCAVGTPAWAIDMAHSNRVTVDSVRDDLARFKRDSDGCLYLDYYCGRALKLKLDPKAQEFNERLYDRDAGLGAAQRVVDRLRSKAA